MNRDASRGVIYQAGIVAFHEVHEKLAHLNLHLETARKREPRADGSWVERVFLRPEQIEPIVAAGAVVVLEGIIDARFPADWIISREEALARLNELAGKDTSEPG